MPTHSIVEFFTNEEPHSCGYCKGENGSISNGMWAHVLTVDDYQELIDRGFRRSGKYCYKPILRRTCCPQYTIRCKVNNFQISRSHKKVLKKINSYLKDGNKLAEARDCAHMSQCETMIPEYHEKVQPINDSIATTSKALTVLNEPNVSDQKDVCATGVTVTNGGNNGISGNVSHSLNNHAHYEHNLDAETGVTNRQQKKRVFRRERWMKKHNLTHEEARKLTAEINREKSLSDYLKPEEIGENAAHKLELKLVRSNPPSEEFNSSANESFEVYKKYQVAIHGDSESKLTKKQWTRFLVDSPLAKHVNDEVLWPEGFGSFHQQYLLDGKIIAVAVLDILPSCVSSVYLYYDPSYSFLGLGTYSALREIDFVRQLSLKEPAVSSYYMGYYIHSCPKMRYKGQYVPSFLACPETYQWISIDRCRILLDVNKYSRFSPLDAEDINRNINTSNVRILLQGRVMTYGMYRELMESADSRTSDQEDVELYAGLVGRVCSTRMLLYRDL